MNINEKIKEIEQILQNGTIISPQDIAEYHRILAGTYSFYCSEMANWEIIKNKEIEANRHTLDCKSDAQAERQFLRTNGQPYIRLKYQLKALERLLSSLKLTAEQAKNEYQNAKYN